MHLGQIFAFYTFVLFITCIVWALHSYLVSVDFFVGGQLDVLQVAGLRFLKHKDTEVVLVGGHAHVLALIEAGGAVPPVFSPRLHPVPVTARKLLVEKNAIEVSNFVPATVSARVEAEGEHGHDYGRAEGHEGGHHHLLRDGNGAERKKKKRLIERRKFAVLNWRSLAANIVLVPREVEVAFAHGVRQRRVAPARHVRNAAALTAGAALVVVVCLRNPNHL